MGHPEGLTLCEATGVGRSAIGAALNDAYSEYPVPFRLTDAQLDLLLRQRGFAAPLSAVALAPGGEVAAFWLSGIHRGEPDCAYVISVGVRRRHLRRGLARSLFDFVAPRLRARGLRRLRLEVLEDNVAARALYAALGFAAVRRLECLRGEPVGLPQAPAWPVRQAQLRVLEALDAANADRRASWQHDADALRAVAGQLDVRAVFDGDECLAAGALLLPSRGIARLVVAREHRRRGLGSAMLWHWSRSHGPGSFSAINVDADDMAALAFLRARGFVPGSAQLELVRPL